MDLTRVLAVVPAYNEGTRIGRVVDGLTRQGLAVLVVDDGSRDGTAAAAEAAGALVLSKPNGGKGSALRAGLRLGRARGPHRGAAARWRRPA